MGQARPHLPTVEMHVPKSTLWLGGSPHGPTGGHFCGMVQLQLNDTALASELGMFLRRCECVVEHLGPNTLGVAVRHGIDVDAAVRQLRAGRCYRCGDEIESTVFGLGSPLCLDCRPGSNGVAEGLIRDEWARMEVEAYVKVWQALHPAGRVELIA